MLVIPVLEVGGTHVTAALVTVGAWTIHRERRWPLDGGAPADVLLGALVGAAQWLGAPAGSHWGVAMPGPFDYAAGVGRFRGVGKFETLAGIDIGSALAAGLANQPSGIRFVNDASAFLLGEWLAGSARGTAACVGITLGTGVGSGFLRDGEIIERGEQVPPDGELHLLSHRGVPLEDWVSRRALIAAYESRAGVTVDVREMAALAREGDVAAAEVFARAFSVLGEVLGPWLTRFGAQALIVGGSISGAWDLIAEPLAAGLAAAAPGVRLRRASQGERAALIGAALAGNAPAA